MDDRTYVKPLPYKVRRNFFGLLVFVFIVVLPFLYLYATGYRFDMQKPTNLVSTGGIYVAVDRTGAEIYIDGELVRETRAFRRAFYAQNLDIGTHRVHVQKEGHHTWVKELPVAKRLVTEAEAFNFPLIPEVRVIGQWLTATGSTVVREVPAYPLITNGVIATTTKRTSAFIENVEFNALMVYFATTSTSTGARATPIGQIRGLFAEEATSTDAAALSATSTVTVSGVRLKMDEDELFATWTGPFEQMPYYYCAADFPPYSTTTDDATLPPEDEPEEPDTFLPEDDGVVMHPVQTIPKDAVCEPTIRIDRKGQEVRDFDFFPGNTDLVVVVLEDGIYVVEIDDRSWQNMQPLMLGNNLRMYIENGNIFVYDGELIYQILLATE
jgi:hypothetical protein